MLIENCQPDPKDYDALFRIATGERVTITSSQIVVTRARAASERVSDRVQFTAVATDVFMKMDNVIHRLFVGVSVDFGAGLKHVWLTDGPNDLDDHVLDADILI